MKRYAWLATGLLLVAVLGGLFIGWRRQSADETTDGYAVRRLQLERQTIGLWVADSDAKRQLGLGRRDGMPADRGMLFVFDRPQPLCFWMKDMRFSLDMIWLDAAKQVVRVKPAVAPDTYPENFCAPADRPAQYVVELNAGRAAALGIREGQRLPF